VPLARLHGMHNKVSWEVIGSATRKAHFLLVSLPHNDAVFVRT
jgi:hypothetical protein